MSSCHWKKTLNKHFTYVLQKKDVQEILGLEEMLHAIWVQTVQFYDRVFVCWETLSRFFLQLVQKYLYGFNL